MGQGRASPAHGSANWRQHQRRPCSPLPDGRRRRVAARSRCTAGTGWRRAGGQRSHRLSTTEKRFARSKASLRRRRSPFGDGWPCSECASWPPATMRSDPPRCAPRPTWPGHAPSGLRLTPRRRSRERLANVGDAVGSASGFGRASRTKWQRSTRSKPPRGRSASRSWARVWLRHRRTHVARTAATQHPKPA